MHIVCFIILWTQPVSSFSMVETRLSRAQTVNALYYLLNSTVSPSPWDYYALNKIIIHWIEEFIWILVNPHTLLCFTFCFQICINHLVRKSISSIAFRLPKSRLLGRWLHCAISGLGDNYSSITLCKAKSCCFNNI